MSEEATRLWLVSGVCKGPCLEKLDLPDRKTTHASYLGFPTVHNVCRVEATCTIIVAVFARKHCTISVSAFISVYLCVCVCVFVFVFVFVSPDVASFDEQLASGTVVVWTPV